MNCLLNGGPLTGSSHQTHEVKCFKRCFVIKGKGCCISCSGLPIASISINFLSRWRSKWWEICKTSFKFSCICRRSNNQWHLELIVSCQVGSQTNLQYLEHMHSQRGRKRERRRRVHCNSSAASCQLPPTPWKGTVVENHFEKETLLAFYSQNTLIDCDPGALIL